MTIAILNVKTEKYELGTTLYSLINPVTVLATPSGVQYNSQQLSMTGPIHFPTCNFSSTFITKWLYFDLKYAT